MDPDCMSCKIANRTLEAEGSEISRTAYFNLSQDFEYMIPGFLIVASNRHFKAVDEMTKEEGQDFIEVVIKVRKAQREVLGIEDVYYFYNEDTRHHFHLWMIPRMDWMKQFGRSIESVAPMLKYAKENFGTDEKRDEVRGWAERMREGLRNSNPRCPS